MDYQELCSMLISKGEAIEDRRGDHVFYIIAVDGHEYRATKVSHNARGQISGDLIGLISRQMRLTMKELRQFVSCTVTREKWMELWQQRGHNWRR